MVDITTQTIKYVMILLMALYTVTGFAALFMKRPGGIRTTYRLMLVNTYAMHICGFAVLYLKTGDFRLLIIGVFELLFLFIYPLLFTLCYRYANRMLLNHLLYFLSIGSVMLIRLNYDKAMRQLIFIAGAAVITLIIPKYIEKLERAKVTAGVLGVMGLLLLAVVLAVGKVQGSATYGANLSLSFGGLTVQPSELVKVSFVFLIAMLFRKRDDAKRVIFASAIAVAHVGVLVLSKDLGSALIFFLAYMNMLAIAVKDVRWQLAGYLLFAAAGTFCFFVFRHVRTRILVWLDPWKDVSNTGYQVAMSLFAIGAGGWFGSGLCEGRPLTIPVVTKDFVFSAIAEELGGVYAILLIAVCLLCLWVMLEIAGRMEVLFYRLVGVGLATVYGVQVLLTIGGALKFIPSTGVTLPLVSYGGSSVVGTFVLFAVMQGIFHRKQEEVESFERDKRKEQKRQQKAEARLRAEARVRLREREAAGSSEGQE